MTEEEVKKHAEERLAEMHIPLRRWAVEVARKSDPNPIYVEAHHFEIHPSGALVFVVSKPYIRHSEDGRLWDEGYDKETVRVFAPHAWVEVMPAVDG